MRYQQFRIAKRKGEIVQQRRYVHTTARPLFRWWQFWNWAEYDVDVKYDPWEDLPIVDADAE